MRSPLPHLVRGHGRRPLVVVAALVALLSLARPAGADGVPVAPVPVGVWPLQPRPQVVRAFEPPGSVWGPGHRGVDLSGSVGEVVRASLAGRVAFASTLAGRGVVVVADGSSRTTYEPVTATVRVGDLVEPGQPLGVLQLPGSHCFPRACLHWGWLRGSTYLDPLLLVGGQPIVLLPLWYGPAGPPVTGPPVPGPPGLLPPYAEVVAALTVRRPPRPRPPERAGVRAWTPGRPVWRRPLAMRPLLL